MSKVYVLKEYRYDSKNAATKIIGIVSKAHVAAKFHHMHTKDDANIGHTIEEYELDDLAILDYVAKGKI